MGEALGGTGPGPGGRAEPRSARQSAGPGQGWPHPGQAREACTHPGALCSVALRKSLASSLRRAAMGLLQDTRPPAHSAGGTVTLSRKRGGAGQAGNRQSLPSNKAPGDELWHHSHPAVSEVPQILPQLGTPIQAKPKRVSGLRPGLGSPLRLGQGSRKRQPAWGPCFNLRLSWPEVGTGLNLQRRPRLA